MKHRAVGKSNEAPILAHLSNCFSSAIERAQIRSRFLLDTSLSSSPISHDSTRHSVTSRIHCNSRAFYHLIFSTRHLNATLEKRNNVEKFNSPQSGIDSKRGPNQFDVGSQLIRSGIRLN